MNNQIIGLGENLVVNMSTVTYIRRHTEGAHGPFFEIHFIGTSEPIRVAEADEQGQNLIKQLMRFGVNTNFRKLQASNDEPNISYNLMEDHFIEDIDQ